VLDVLVAEVVLKSPRVVAVIGSLNLQACRSKCGCEGEDAHAHAATDDSSLVIGCDFGRGIDAKIDRHLDVSTAILARPDMTDFVLAHVCGPLWCDQ
jgi:hypothetical protein